MGTNESNIGSMIHSYFVQWRLENPVT